MNQIDMQTIKEELKNIGELYFEINSYLKIQTEQVKNQKRPDNLNWAMAKRRNGWNKNKRVPNEKNNPF